MTGVRGGTTEEEKVRGGGGGARDANLKTKIPHSDAGKNQQVSDAKNVQQ